MKLEIEIELPDGAVDKSAEAELIRSVKEQAVLKLYTDGRVTTGEAAGMLDLTRIQFLDLLRRTGTRLPGRTRRRRLRTDPALARGSRAADQTVSAVVSDSSPLNYLALLSDFDLLRANLPPSRDSSRGLSRGRRRAVLAIQSERLYKRLSDAWMSVADSAGLPRRWLPFAMTFHLDLGESEAILVAESLDMIPFDGRTPRRSMRPFARNGRKTEPP